VLFKCERLWLLFVGRVSRVVFAPVRFLGLAGSSLLFGCIWFHPVVVN
jgi:hypothetical protein